MRRFSESPRAAAGLCILLVLLVAANLRAGLTSLGPVLAEVSSLYELGGIGAGLLTATPLIAFAVASPAAPELTRRVGLERALLLALVSVAGGLLLRSAPSVMALFLGTAILSAAIAVGNVLLPVLVKRDFPASIGLVTSCYVTAMGFVAALATGTVVPISRVVPGGWHTALASWVLPALVAAGVCALAAGTHAHAGAPMTAMGSSQRTPFPLWDRLAWMVTLFMGLQSLGFFVVVAWLPSILRSNGLSDVAAGWHQAAVQGVAVLSSLTMSVLLRRASDQRALAVGASLLSLTGYLSLLVAPGHSTLSVLLLGSGSGSCIVLALAFMGLRSSDIRTAAALSGMAQAVGYLIAAPGALLVGMLRSADSAWRAPLLLLSVVAIVQAAAGFHAGRGFLTTSPHSLPPGGT